MPDESKNRHAIKWMSDLLIVKDFVLSVIGVIGGVMAAIGWIVWAAFDKQPPSIMAAIGFFILVGFIVAAGIVFQVIGKVIEKRKLALAGETELETATKRLQEQSDEFEAIQLELQQQIKQSFNLKHQVSDLTQQIGHLKPEAEKVPELQNTIVALRSQNEGIEDLKTFKNKSAKLEREKDKLARELSQTSQRLQEANNRDDDLQQRFDRVIKALENHIEGRPKQYAFDECKAWINSAEQLVRNLPITNRHGFRAFICTREEQIIQCFQDTLASLRTLIARLKKNEVRRD